MDRPRPRKTGRYDLNLLEWWLEEPIVKENPFLARKPNRSPVPSLSASISSLPDPHWEGHPDAVAAYWKAWEIAFRNLLPATEKNDFCSASIDTAFNDCIFMWDTVFILQFGRYGDRAFKFQGTLDNFYRSQHRDGFICREIRKHDGSDQWHRHDPVSTGPNLMAWAEWEYFQNFGDLKRLRDVYPALLGYHLWMRRFRSWPDGSYWTTGLGCGMDNMSRVPEGRDPGGDHAHMAWADATFQAVLSARLLAQVGDLIGRPKAETDDLASEADRVMKWANDHLWDEEQGFFFDKTRDGRLNGVKSVAAYWSLLAGNVAPDRSKRLVAHLRDPKSFNRPHRVPSMAADADGYEATGGYWRGGVWPPTNYMVLRSLSRVSEDALAHEIAMNHHSNVVEVFRKTGTLHENYAPERAEPGQPAMKDFVGWGGVPPITVLLEYVFGLRPIDVRQGKLLWDIRLTDAFGVDRYPFGPEATLDLRSEKRDAPTQKPQVTVRSTHPVTVEIRWEGGSEVVQAGNG